MTKQRARAHGAAKGDSNVWEFGAMPLNVRSLVAITDLVPMQSMGSRRAYVHVQGARTSRPHNRSDSMLLIA